MHKAGEAGIRIKVISGHRTYEEQDALYAQGRTLPGDRITNARAGYSNHNFRLAFDVGVLEGNRYLGDSPKCMAVGVLGMDLGLEWGGNWKTIVDQPHSQAPGMGPRPDGETDARPASRARCQRGIAVRLGSP